MMNVFRKSLTGKGIRIAVIDSGANTQDPRLRNASIQGWSIRLESAGHATLSGDFHDENGHGTDIAAAVLSISPQVELLAIKIMETQLQPSAERMAAGIETATKQGAQIILLPFGTPNMGKALLLRDCCSSAWSVGSIVVAAAHPRGERIYPADLPEALGVSSHPEYPLEEIFYFDPSRFPAKTWKTLSGKFIASGVSQTHYIGTSIASAHFAGYLARMGEALGGEASAWVDELKKQNI